MKKKLWGVLVTLLAFLFVAGCGTQKSASAKTAKPEERLQATSYQNLSKQERKDVKFKFYAVKDSTGYAVYMNVMNKTAKDIKFNLADFKILNPEDPSFKADSNLKKECTVNIGDDTSVDKLFDHISAEDFDSQSGYYYLSKKYWLGDLKNTSGLSEQQTGSDQASTYANNPDVDTSTAQVNVVPEGSATSAQSAKTSTVTKLATSSSSTKSVITNSAQAVALYKHAMALAGRNDIQATPVKGGFAIYSTEDPSIGNNFIAYDGDMDSNGEVSPYSQVSKQTYNDQPGDGQFNPSNY